MFKRILVTVDGSDISNQALQEAIKLTKENEAQLRIVHVVDTVTFDLNLDFSNISEISTSMINSGRGILEKAVAVARAAGITAETSLIERDTLDKRVPELIMADAETWPADLIVICTHGRTGLSHLFLGSVAERLVRVATKPILLIRGK